MKKVVEAYRIYAKPVLATKYIRKRPKIKREAREKTRYWWNSALFLDRQWWRKGGAPPKKYTYGYKEPTESKGASVHCVCGTKRHSDETRMERNDQVLVI